MKSCNLFILLAMSILSTTVFAEETQTVKKLDPIKLNGGQQKIDVTITNSSNPELSNVEVSTFNAKTYSLTKITLNKQELKEYIELLQKAESTIN